MKNEVCFKVSGRYALFTDPLTKIGGEKSSLSIPTYQALKAITENIYWKPSISIFIKNVRIMKPIRTESKGIRPIKYGGGNDLSIYNYLSDVEYIVTAYFEFNKNRPDLKDDWCENKHYFIMKRCIEKGGRRNSFLGVSECQAYIEPANFDEGIGYYDNMGEMGFGLQYHSLSYPDENGNEEINAKFWSPKMVNGVIEFCKPDDCPKEVFVRKMKPKVFDGNNFSGLNESELLDGYETLGVIE
jgi:CRISPR-associated protein Cas5d